MIHDLAYKNRLDKILEIYVLLNNPVLWDGLTRLPNMTFPSVPSMNPREFCIYLWMNKPETSLKDLALSSVPVPISTLLHSSTLSSKFLLKLGWEKAHRGEEDKCESSCVAIQEMSEFLPWTEGMGMLEKGRKKKEHDLLEMWSENYGQSPRSTPHPATLLLLPMSSTSGSETLSFCLLTSKYPPPLSSVQEFLWDASVMI